MEEYKLRTIQIWLDDSFMEIELPQPEKYTENEFTEVVINYVFSNISIDIL